MPTLKLVLLGDSSVGKSSLVNRFAVDSFDPHSPNTIGAAFISKEHTSNNRKLKFEIWDTAGQERYKSLTPMYYRNAKVALVCFDLSQSSSSFQRAKYWIEQLQLSGPSEINIRVVGTKADLLEGSGSSGELAVISEYCSDHGLEFIRTSAKTGEGITPLFDSVVDSLDEEYFQTSDSETGESASENVFLRMHNRSSSCC